MKKRRTIIALVIAVGSGIFFVSPPGRVLADNVLFMIFAVDYFRKEAAAERRINAMTEEEFRVLANKVAVLAAKHVPQPDSTQTLVDRGVPIPESLKYLNPQRVWLSDKGASIELLHMMDADTTLEVKLNQDGLWSVSGHFGDFMNKPRLLWKEKKS